MKRVVLFLCAAALTAPALAQAGVAHPNPAFISPQVDYVGPLRGANGQVATLAPLETAVTDQAVRDQAWLGYLKRDDLGGFLPAPVGQFALSSGGRVVVGAGGKLSEIPQLAQAASGDVQSYAFVPGGGKAPPADNGRGSVPGLGVPTPPPPPSNSNTTPPPNQGFGGRPAPPPVTTTTKPAGPGTTTTSPGTTTAPTTTKPKPPPPPPTTTVPTTTPTTPTTTPTTTTTTTTTSSGGGGGGGSPPPVYACGTIGLSITSDLANCRIYAINQAPGDSTIEHVTIRNDSGEPFTLSLKASGTTNRLWNDLQMGVWEQGTPAPSPLPALLLWTAGYNNLTTLQPGQSITYVIELALPASAGNADQGLAAVIDFTWHAQA